MQESGCGRRRRRAASHDGLGVHILVFLFPSPKYRFLCFCISCLVSRLAGVSARAVGHVPGAVGQWPPWRRAPSPERAAFIFRGTVPAFFVFSFFVHCVLWGLLQT